MRRLLAANFRRLLRSISLYIGLAVVIYMTWDTVSSWKYTFEVGYASSYDWLKVFFDSQARWTVVIVTLIVTGIFIGTDFSEGTHRNKITTGGSRGYLYLSNLVVGFFVATIYYLANAFTGYIALNRITTMNDVVRKQLPLAILTFFLALMSLMSIYIAVAHRLKRRTPAIMGGIFVWFLSVNFGGALYSLMNQSKYYTDVAKRVLNPNYIDGPLRKIITSIMYVEPGSHMEIVAQYMNPDKVVHFNMNIMCACSVAVILVATIIGSIVFIREDLK